MESLSALNIFQDFIDAEKELRDRLFDAPLKLVQGRIKPACGLSMRYEHILEYISTVSGNNVQNLPCTRVQGAPSVSNSL
jgi:hypothetical protein